TRALPPAGACDHFRNHAGQPGFEMSPGGNDGDFDTRYCLREEFAEFPGGSGRLRAGSLRPGGRGRGDRPHEIPGLRGRGDQSVRRQQPADELGLRVHERPGFLGRAGRRRGRHRAAHRRPPVLASGFRPRERPGGRDVPHDPEFPRHHTGSLGVESGRLPRAVGDPGAVPHQGPSPARDFALVARRRLAGQRANVMSTDNAYARQGLFLIAARRLPCFSSETAPGARPPRDSASSSWVVALPASMRRCTWKRPSPGTRASKSSSSVVRTSSSLRRCFMKWPPANWRPRTSSTFFASYCSAWISSWATWSLSTWPAGQFGFLTAKAITTTSFPSTTWSSPSGRPQTSLVCRGFRNGP